MKTNPAWINNLGDAEEVPIRPSSLSVSPHAEHSAAAGVSWLHRFAALVTVLELVAFVVEAVGPSNSGIYLDLNRWLSEAFAATAVILAIWLFREGCARYVKIIGLTVSFLALGQTVMERSAASQDPSPARVLTHGPLTLLLFSLAVMLALFTRTDWRWDLPKIPDVAAPSFRHLSVFTALTLFAVTVAGSIHASGRLRLAPHFVGGIVATIGALWMLEIALNQFSALGQLKIGVVILAELVVIELLLGLVSYHTELDSHSHGLGRPLPGLAVMRATHAAVGALTLAASLFAMLQSFRYLRRRNELP